MVENKHKNSAPEKAVASPAKRRRADVSVMGGAGLEKQVRHNENHAILI